MNPVRITVKLAVDTVFVLIELFSLDVAAEALRASIDSKSAILKGVGQFQPKKGRPPPTISARLDRPVNPYNFVVDSIHTKKLCSRLSSGEVQF